LPRRSRRRQTPAGGSTRATLHCSFALAAAAATDLIEENSLPIGIAGRDLRLDPRPFDILTLLLSLGH
jgi:hypothetical protein